MQKNVQASSRKKEEGAVNLEGVRDQSGQLRTMALPAIRAQHDHVCDDAGRARFLQPLCHDRPTHVDVLHLGVFAHANKSIHELVVAAFRRQ